MGLRVSISILVMSLYLSGCTQPLNDRLTIGGRFVSPSLNTAISGQTQSTAPVLFSETVPERSGWRSTTFVVPFDGVVHGQTLVLLPPLRPDAPARAYGRFPTRIDALDPQRRGWAGDFFESGRELGRSLVGTLYAVGYLVWNGELERPALSPTPYKRTRQDEWSSGQPARSASEQDDE